MGWRLRKVGGLITERSDEAKESLKRHLVSEVRSLQQRDDVGPTDMDRQRRDLEDRVWELLENGELDRTQHGFMLDLIREGDRGAVS